MARTAGMTFDVNITTLTAALGFVFNCFLIFLIVAYRQTTNIGSFKWALVLLASLEAVFAIDLILAPPYFIIFDGNWIVLAFDTPLPDDVVSYLASFIYCTLHQVWVGIIAALFLYRYLVICQETFLRFLKTNKWAAVLTFSVYGTHVLTSIFCGIIFCEHNTMNENPIGWVAFWNHVFIYYGSVPVYLFCSISMYIKIRKSSKIVDNKATLEMQRRMFYLVLIQTLTPLLMSNSPFLAMLTFPWWSPDFTFTSTTTMMPLLTTIPKMVDPIAIMVFLPSLRNAAISLVLCILVYGTGKSINLGKKMTAATSVVSVTVPATNLTF